MSDDFDKRFDEMKAALDGVAPGQLRLPFPGSASASAEELIRRFSALNPTPAFVLGAAVKLSDAPPEPLLRDGHADEVFVDLPFDHKTVADCKAKFVDSQKVLQGFSGGAVEEAAPKITIQVYLKNGQVREYDVDTQAAAREHAYEIIQTGYRAVDETDPTVLTHWPPHEIKKVKIKAPAPWTTRFFDRVRGT
ncbi:hypothetical protein CcrKarma_gp049 [Caulobacter virus Karma]|uniref:hypothetical protein n=1 Tax=Caulobacter virus Karma TaxID=1211641 RepID=UPI00028B5DFF|nr:hypothetical protein CcrKarma_gp049 [Caulobacter virus Karma]AFU87566.1 hypothetical protein CcrKarma_gp049 [Caulobacter virus Karma]